MEYILNLPSESFLNIKQHAPVVVLPRYYKHPSKRFAMKEVRRLGYLEAIAGVPKDYWVGDPPVPGLLSTQAGVEYAGKLVNPNVVRHQHCVSNLYHIGALQSLITAPSRKTVVEVGAGYGGLAHSLCLILKGKCNYIIIDLPEMLLVSGAYLSLNNPGKSIYIYDAASFTPEFAERGRQAYDFVLVPHFALSKLKLIHDISLLINTWSFQEMTDRQVEEYLEFGASRISGYLYSDNLDKHTHNTELHSLSVSFAKYFDLFPDPHIYDNLYPERPDISPYIHRKYFGVPKASGRMIPSTNIVGFLPFSSERKSRIRSCVRLLLPAHIRTLVIPKRIRKLTKSIEWLP